MTRLIASLLGLAVGAACGGRHPGTRGEDEPSGADGRVVQTSASPTQLTAGEETSVVCTVARDGVVLAEPTLVQATPPAAAITADGAGWRVRLETSGAVLIQCGTADGAVLDSLGVVVDVVPAAPDAVETRLSTSTSAAGLPVAVTCAVTDRFANAVPDVRPSGVDVTGALLVDPPVGMGLVVRGTTVGDATVACRVGAVVDPTPAILTITAGIPGASETTVDKATAAPGEVVTASCAVTDAFGNPLADVATAVVVLAADGTPAAAAGLVSDGASFHATRSGTYYVFCSVPGYAAGDESPAAVTVGWGLPCTWLVELEPQDCYWLGRQLPVSAVAFDAWGNVVEDAGFGLATTPAGGAVAHPQGGWRFVAEGDFELELTVIGALDPTCGALVGSAATPFVTGARVDSTGPTLAITSPARAATVTAGGVDDVAIALVGSVVDAVSPITAVSVNGVALPVSGASLQEPIATMMTSRWGLSIITGAAADECGNRSVLAQSFLRSGAWFAPTLAPDPAARAPQGLVAQLNQGVIDDGDRATLDDLASIGEAVLATQDFNALFPPGYDFATEPLQGGCSFCEWWNDSGYTLERDADPRRLITWAGPWIVSLAAVDGGLRYAVRLDDFAVPMHFAGSNRQCACGVQSTIPLSASGSAGADRVDASGTLAVSLGGSTPQVSVQSMSLATSGLFLSVDCGILQLVCDGVAWAVVALLESTIEDAIAGAIADQIPPLVAGMIAGFALDSGFDVPPPMGVHLELASDLDTVRFCGPPAGIPKPVGCPATSPNPGYGQLGLATQLYPASRGPSIPATAGGAIRKDGALPTFTTAVDQFGLGLKDDLLNQILWAVWYGGGLDLGAAELAPYLGATGTNGVSMSMTATSPPVVMPGRDGNEIELGLGDLYVDASIDLAALLGGEPGVGALTIGLYLSTMLGGSIDVEPTANVLVASFAPAPTVVVEVVAVDDPAYQAAMSELLAGVLGLVVPSLIGGIVSSFPIPAIDLSGIATLPADADAVWTLTGAAVDRTSDYTRISGGLE